ncbi:MAG TPA: winged helix-turn-helix domain-containing protein [Thermoanaerobaculia bacterium]|nr:winged helix-turn-helix domain-containing protein [Thermoanaerobaculia bacterium]
MTSRGSVHGQPEAAAVYEFGPFRFEPGEGRLLRDGSPVPLPPQESEMLLALVERRSSLVTKQELLERVWPDRFVEENSLTKCVSALRKALGDRRVGSRYIETVARRGYRFLPEITRIANSEIRPIKIQVTVELTLDGREPFAGKEEIARKVTAALTGGGQRHELRRRATRDPHAFRLYREARCHVMRYSSSSWQKSVGCYQQAIAQDPSYTLAYTDLAISSVLASVYYTSSREVTERARAAAQRALAIDPGLPEAHLAMAGVRCYLDWDWDGAESCFHQALALNPEQAWSHDYYGFFLTLRRRFREALPVLERAVELNPVRLLVKGDLGLYHHFSGAAEEAIDHQRKALDLDPFCALSRVELARALERAGRPDEALAEIRKTLPLDDAPWVRVWLARAYALTGQREDALRVLLPLRQAARRGMVSPVFPALVHAALGEQAEALALLDEARAQGSPWMAFLAVEPGFDSLREAPGFANLSRRVGLA